MPYSASVGFGILASRRVGLGFGHLVFLILTCSPVPSSKSEARQRMKLHGFGSVVQTEKPM